MTVFSERDERIRAALCEDSPQDLAEQLALINRMVLREQPDADAAVVMGAGLLTEHLAWSCRNCLTDCAEPFCDECGANLMEVKK